MPFSLNHCFYFVWYVFISFVNESRKRNARCDYVLNLPPHAKTHFVYFDYNFKSNSRKRCFRLNADSLSSKKYIYTVHNFSFLHLKYIILSGWSSNERKEKRREKKFYWNATKNFSQDTPHLSVPFRLRANSHRVRLIRLESNFELACSGFWHSKRKLNCQLKMFEYILYIHSYMSVPICISQFRKVKRSRDRERESEEKIKFCAIINIFNFIGNCQVSISWYKFANIIHKLSRGRALAQRYEHIFFYIVCFKYIKKKPKCVCYHKIYDFYEIWIILSSICAEMEKLRHMHIFSYLTRSST